jgi:hypothetical protein
MGWRLGNGAVFHLLPFTITGNAADCVANHPENQSSAWNIYRVTLTEKNFPLDDRMDRCKLPEETPRRVSPDPDVEEISTHVL